MKQGENTSGSVGHLLGGCTGRPHFKSGSRVQKQYFQRCDSELDAKGSFRFWNGAWAVSQRPSLFSPCFISTAFRFYRYF
ncbi:hypothetical protein EDM54_08550 [Brevibacillus borstelensis]|nr:hypothetical protein EDM54_08550 [Brevibacillus borstelensis]